MSAWFEITLYCDGVCEGYFRGEARAYECGDALTFEARTAKDARKQATKFGWSSTRTKDLCKTCTTKGQIS